MELKKINLEFENFSHETMHEAEELLKANCKKYDGPMGDYDANMIKVNEGGNKMMRMRRRRDPEYSVRDLFTALGV